jgi:hypothetical protein
MDVSEARRLNALEDENRRLKQIVVDQTLNMQVSKELLGKDSVVPSFEFRCPRRCLRGVLSSRPWRNGAT